MLTREERIDAFLKAKLARSRSLFIEREFTLVTPDTMSLLRSTLTLETSTTALIRRWREVGNSRAAQKKKDRQPAVFPNSNQMFFVTPLRLIALRSCGAS